MSLLLAPYNDSMRLGMGFNSYTQTLCIDKAVDVRNAKTKSSENTSQVVTYSAKLVENLSDVVNSMNVSHCASIRKGTVEVAGNGDAINEDKIKTSDINAVISVKVVNQTLVCDDDAEFVPMVSVFPGTSAFNDTYGDCFISGFIYGGEFNSVISMRVLDRSKTTSVTDTIKKGLRSGTGQDFTLDMDSSSSKSATTDALDNTETTITVSWMGGGQIKDPTASWTLDTVYAAANAFPRRVAATPQMTWAILTKYKANRSFVATTINMSFSPLEYDFVAGFTSNLFDNYMEYKQLINIVQDIMSNPAEYQMGAVANSIPIDVDTLVAVRAAFRIEMNKIVQAVDILSKDPGMLKRSRKLLAEPANQLVQDIIAQATKKVNDDDKQRFWDWESGTSRSSSANTGTPASTIIVTPASSTGSLSDTSSKTQAATQPAAQPASQPVSQPAASSGTQPAARPAGQVSTQSSTATTDQSTDQPSGRAQWVFIEDDSQPIPDGDSSTSSTSQPVTANTTPRPVGWYHAWIQDDAAVVNKDVLPTVIAKTAVYGKAYVSAPLPQSTTATRGTSPNSKSGMWAYEYVEFSSLPKAAVPTASSTSSTGKDGQSNAVPVTGGTSGSPAGTSSTQSGTSTNPSGSSTAPVTPGQSQSGQSGTIPSQSNKNSNVPGTFDTYHQGIPDQSNEIQGSALNFDVMISPEIWAALLPKSLDGSAPKPAAANSDMPVSLAAGFPKAPTDDLGDLARRGPVATMQLEIMSAAIGAVDCTDNLREMIKADNTLIIQMKDLQDLMVGHTSSVVYGSQATLAFVFRYTGQPMRLCVTNPRETDKIYSISPSATDFPTLKPGDWNPDTWSVLAIVYGAKYFSDPGVVSAILAEIKKNYNDGKGVRYVSIKDIVKEDPLVGFSKTAAIFYQIRADGRVHCAAGIENSTPCVLSDRLLIDVVDPLQAKANSDQLIQLQNQVTQVQNQLKGSQASNTELATQVESLKRNWQVTGLPNDSGPDGIHVLSAAMNGAKFNLVNMKTRQAFDYGGGVHFYPDSLYDHPNQTFKFELVSSSNRNDGWILRTSDNKCLAILNNRAVVTDWTGDELQRWLITTSADGCGIRICTKKWGDCWLQDSNNEIWGLKIPSDDNRLVYEWDFRRIID